MNLPERVKTFVFRRDLAWMIERVKDRPVEVLQHGQRVAVLISPEDYEDLKQLRGMYTTLHAGPENA